jgi:hypothetical protein
MDVSREVSGFARVFIRVVDHTGQMVDLIGTCDSVDVDATFSGTSKVMKAEQPIGKVRFINLQADAFKVFSSGHAGATRLLVGKEIPTERDIND